MSVSEPSLDTASLVALRVQRITQDQAKQQSSQVVQLIEQANPPPIGPNGEGSHVNLYA